MDLTNVIAIVTAVTALVGAIAALYKLRESTQAAGNAGKQAAAAVVEAETAAEKVRYESLIVTVQALSQENERLRDCVEALETNQKTIKADHAHLQRELTEALAQLAEEKTKNRQLRAENAAWKDRVRKLEKDYAELRTQVRLANGGGQ